MADKTGIQWTDATWNPLRGCTRVSEGCRNCYAESIAARFSGPGMPYEGLAEKTPSGPRWTNTIRLLPELLEQPLKWKRPRRIFVNSMSDLFHKDVPDEFIERVFAVMALAQWHTFQVLTKRPERMLEWVSRQTGLESTAEMVASAAAHMGKIVWDPRGDKRYLYDSRGDVSNRRAWPGWPLPNVWLGTSVEDQAAADKRIPLLLQTPAAVRFLSCEPLLGPVTLRSTPEGQRATTVRNWLEYGQRVSDGMFNPISYCRIDWVIAGGESGANARPCDPEWVRSLRDQCQRARVPFYFKQWGGKVAKSGGRLLDDVEWAQFPEQVPA